MNFLAHTYLSFTDEQIVGNLIGDFIKNKKRDHLSEGIQQGITLHRAIDAFTDILQGVTSFNINLEHLITSSEGQLTILSDQ